MMRTTGIIIIVIGIVVTLITSFNVVTKKKVVDIGNLEITKDENHFFSWSPLIGVALMVVGGGVFFYSTRK